MLLFFFTVRLLVSFKIIGLSETSPTRGTPERFLPCVYSPMSSEIRRDGKTHATRVTPVRFLTRVSTLVQTEATLPHKSLPALITPVRFLLRANLFSNAVGSRKGDSSRVYFLVRL